MLCSVGNILLKGRGLHKVVDTRKWSSGEAVSEVCQLQMSDVLKVMPTFHLWASIKADIRFCLLLCLLFFCLVQFSSVAQLCLILCDPMNHSTPGLLVHHQLPESTQTHVHWVSDAIQPSYPLSSPSPPDFNLSQHQSLFKWVSSSHQVAKVLEFQLQHQSSQWIFRTDFL